MKKCPVCGFGADIFCQKDKLIVYKCKSCGLGFTEGAEIQVGDYHRDDVYIAGKKLFTNIYQKRVNLINKFRTPPGKVLEIGSSTGLLLSIFKKKGWEVLGVELSIKAAEFARKSGIPTLSAKFEEINLPGSSFDLIIVNHTLEHMAQPLKVLKKANLLLKTGGKILIAVPNFGGISARICGQWWPYLLPQEHLWHFTYPSLKILLSKCGFKDVYHEMPSGIWDCGNPFLELWQSFVMMKKRFIRNFLSATLDFIIYKLGWGSGIIIVAEKNKR